MTGKREDHMDVVSREQFLATFCDPTVAGNSLTLAKTTKLFGAV
jgi:hypothetical protein